jgi:hypothetical protein
MQRNHLLRSLLMLLAGSLTLSLAFALLPPLPAASVAPQQRGYLPAMQPAGAGHILFTSRRDSGDPEIYGMNADGSEQVNYTGSPATLDLYPTWSPDGTRIAFTSNREDDNYEIYTMQADGSGITRLTNNDVDDTWPTWSPDGQRIAFTRVRDGSFEVYTMQIDGAEQTNVSDHPGNDLWPAWSPDGQRIAFSSDRDSEFFEVYSSNADGTDLTRLTFNQVFDAFPDWSPDGQRILFASDRDGNSNIYVMNADGSGQTRLTDHEAIDEYPTWSPDGQRIAFTSNRDGNEEIYVMATDGSGQTRLTLNEVQDTYADWGTAATFPPTAAPPPPQATLPPDAVPEVPTDARCFVETGYCISGRIREFWEQNGGLPVFGLPITEQREEMIEDVALQVQWFERNRLELHPENPPPYDVLLGRLGIDRLEQQGRDWTSFPTAEPLENCRFFPETAHNVCGDMLALWEANGLELDGVAGTIPFESLALFGLPLSEPQLETLGDGEVYTVQWFERARFELHLENEQPYHVLLGLLGREVLENRVEVPTTRPTSELPLPTATPTTPLLLPSPTPTHTPLPTLTPTLTPTPEPTLTATPLPTATPTPRITRATGTIRFVNETYGRLEIELYGYSGGVWALGLDETLEVRVVPGDYRVETRTICGDNTREFFVGHMETVEDRYECSVNAP